MRDAVFNVRSIECREVAKSVVRRGEADVANTEYNIMLARDRTECSQRRVL